MQYYSFWENDTRKKAMYNYCLTNYYIHTIKNAINNGVIPTEDPNLSSQFYILIDEYGIELFVDELSGANLLYENNTLKRIT